MDELEGRDMIGDEVFVLIVWNRADTCVSTLSLLCGWMIGEGMLSLSVVSATCSAPSLVSCLLETNFLPLHCVCPIAFISVEVESSGFEVPS